MRNRHSLKPICACVLLALASPAASANPLDPTVVNGQAGFATTGNTLTVTNTPGTIINWQGFSIGANETTRFAQQSAASAVLNRVISNNPSSILGALQSNGRVFLINPNGIVFGAGATVDVAGLVASTLNLSDADFLAGRNHFTNPSPAGGGAGVGVINAGNITAQGDGQTGGQIFLIAPNVENTGVITAPNGEILLAAGYSVDLVSTSDPNLRVNITAPAGDATNVGQLIASSGSLGLFGTVVRNSGTVSADSATMQGGKIVFKASQRVEISGTVSANSTAVPSPSGGGLGWGNGGTIEVLGNQVGIMDGATVSANGTQGGGTVLIGGDAHGANPDVPNAQVTYVAPAATISADATDNGNGGKVVVWADNATQFNGNIFARGGAVSGNGGWVEVSGKQWLGYAGLVNTTAANGMVGSLLLDPTDITIGVAANTNTMTCTAAGVCTDTTATPSNLNVTTLVNQLLLSNVTVDTTSGLGGAGNITIADSLVYSSPNTLTLNAAGTGFIQVNTYTSSLIAVIPLVINVSGGGSLVMQTAGGSIGISAFNGVSITGGGSFTANAVGATSDIIINSAINTGAGAINLTAGRSIAELGSLTTSGLLTTSSVGGTTLNGANAVGSFNATNSGNGNIALTNNAGTLTVTGINNTFATGSDTVNNTGAISITGTIAAAGGGAINLTSSGSTISETGAGLISTTGLLTTSSVGGTTLSGANTVGSFNATNTTSGAISLTNTALDLALSGISQTGGGAVTLVVNGNLTLNALSTITAGTAQVTLSATGGNFANNSGSATPITTTGLIRIYSTSPVLDTPGGLVGNYRLYDCTYAGGCSAGTVIPAGQVGLYYSIAPAPVVGEITNISDQQLKKLENMVALDIPADKDDNKPALPVCN